jgi:hypothetical protein
MMKTEQAPNDELLYRRLVMEVRGTLHNVTVDDVVTDLRDLSRLNEREDPVVYINKHCNVIVATYASEHLASMVEDALNAKLASCVGPTCKTLRSICRVRRVRATRHAPRGGGVDQSNQQAGAATAGCNNNSSTAVALATQRAYIQGEIASLQRIHANLTACSSMVFHNPIALTGIINSIQDQCVMRNLQLQHLMGSGYDVALPNPPPIALNPSFGATFPSAQPPPPPPNRTVSLKRKGQCYRHDSSHEIDERHDDDIRRRRRLSDSDSDYDSGSDSDSHSDSDSDSSDDDDDDREHTKQRSTLQQQQQQLQECHNNKGIKGDGSRMNNSMAMRQRHPQQQQAKSNGKSALGSSAEVPTKRTPSAVIRQSTSTTVQPSKTLDLSSHRLSSHRLSSPPSEGECIDADGDDLYADLL